MEYKNGDLRIWWIPQVPMEAFYVYIQSLVEAKKILTVLADYDMFQYNNNVKPDYCNVGGLQIYEKEEGEWLDWESEDGESIDDLSISELEKLNACVCEYDNIPDAILLAINNHVLRGQHCGHFVTAVLSNDLIEAVNRADDECQKCLRSIVRYLYNRCPGGCWGSKKKMEEWRKNGGIEGKEVGDIGDLIYPK
jgi:hypothetical protein